MRFALGSLALVTFAIAQSAAAAHERLLVVTVKSVETSARAIDVAPKGMTNGKFSAGDVLVVRDRLVNLAPQLGRPTGASVGTDQARIRFLSAAEAEIVGSATFPAGSVRFRGRAAMHKGKLVLSVTGGTGAYANARGTVVEPGTDSDPANARNTYRLSLP
jgi:hypothetical protein